jgi:alkylhydroperoxidase/carboxymuconolactone decarboxylase family protein YurZ
MLGAMATTLRSHVMKAMPTQGGVWHPSIQVGAFGWQTRNGPCFEDDRMKDDTMPSVVDRFAQTHPEVWNAYNQLGNAVASAGPIDAKTQRLLKLAIAVGAAREGAVRSHARRGLKAGLTPAELEQAALLGITTVGWPAAFAARCWIEEEIEKALNRTR